MMKKVSRRSFLANSSLLSFAGFAGFLPFMHKSKKKKKGTFVHHVFFWMKSPDVEEERKKLLKGIRSLKQIDVIRMSHIGVPADTNREVIENGYDFSLLFTFDNLEDQNIYQKHPIHLKFVEECSALWEKVIVYDSVEV